MGNHTKIAGGGISELTRGNYRMDAADTITNYGGDGLQQNGANGGVINGKNEKVLTLLITKVEGPFDDNGNLVHEAVINTFYTYKATPSRVCTSTEALSVKWSIKLDNEQPLAVAASLYNRLDSERITIKLKISDPFETAKVYAFFKKKDDAITVSVGGKPEEIVRIEITGTITGYTIQGLKGEDNWFSDPVVIVPTYKASVFNDLVIDDTVKSKNLISSFDITRDAWYSLGKDKTGVYRLLNRAFVPEHYSQNLYTAIWIPSYPRFSGQNAFILTRFGDKKIPAKPLLTQTCLNGKSIDSPRKAANIASDVLIHIGGTYEVANYDHIGGSYGCFAFIPKDDIYGTPELAEQASKNDDYDDKTSNADWGKVTNEIKRLAMPSKKIRIEIKDRNESKNYEPNVIINE